MCRKSYRENILCFCYVNYDLLYFIERIFAGSNSCHIYIYIFHVDDEVNKVCLIAEPIHGLSIVEHSHFRYFPGMVSRAIAKNNKIDEFPWQFQ